MAKELNPISTSQSADVNENIQNYMMNMGQSPYGAPLPQENAVGPAQTSQTNPEDGSQVVTGESDVAINSTIPKTYGPGTGTVNDVANNDTMLYNKDEDPNQYTA